VERVHALVVGRELPDLLGDLEEESGRLKGAGGGRRRGGGGLTSSRKGLGWGLLLSRATATLEPVQ